MSQPQNTRNELDVKIRSDTGKGGIDHDQMCNWADVLTGGLT